MCPGQAVTANANSSSGYDTVQAMRPITVAVMDSGVDCFHRDLNVVFNTSFVKVNGQDLYGDTKGCWDVYDHGTNVAGELAWSGHYLQLTQAACYHAVQTEVISCCLIFAFTFSTPACNACWCQHAPHAI